MRRILTVCLSTLLLLSADTAFAARKVKTKVPPDPQKELKDKLNRYFNGYSTLGQTTRTAARLQQLSISDSLQTIEVTADSHFGENIFTPTAANNIYRDVMQLMPDSIRTYQLKITSGGWDIRQLVPYRLQENPDDSRSWGDISYEGKPWVSNVSLPYRITNGLQNRHLCLWASHGRYYNISQRIWKWQRPELFGTTEDLFTQTIVIPYLIPMLEKAGAIVFTPRERDWQRHEVIVDNDSPKGYHETCDTHRWTTADSAGFAFHPGVYYDHENPFMAGTARKASVGGKGRQQSTVTWQPDLPEAGRYAVYVSYQTVDGSIDDAHYTVWHQGVPTRFDVNQQMGGSTWVYLGTFDFDAGASMRNCVVLTNESRHHKGIVTADAVRFGGGMGNIQRGDTVSGLPRCLEGSRRACQDGHGYCDAWRERSSCKVLCRLLSGKHGRG